MWIIKTFTDTDGIVDPDSVQPVILCSGHNMDLERLESLLRKVSSLGRYEV